MDSLGLTEELRLTAVGVPDTRVTVTVAIVVPPGVVEPLAGVTERLKSKPGATTVREKVAVLTRLVVTEVPVTVTVTGPPVVAPGVAVRVKVEAAPALVGVTGFGPVAVTPEGRPVMLNATSSAVPDSRVAVTVEAALVVP